MPKIGVFNTRLTMGVIVIADLDTLLIAPVGNSESAASFKNSYECVKALSDSDFTQDLERFDVPTLLIHGEDDQVVPVGNSRRSARLIKNAKDIYYPAAPHGITATHQDQVNADLLAFLQS